MTSFDDLDTLLVANSQFGADSESIVSFALKNEIEEKLIEIDEIKEKIA